MENQLEQQQCPREGETQVMMGWPEYFQAIFRQFCRDDPATTFALSRLDVRCVRKEARVLLIA